MTADFLLWIFLPILVVPSLLSITIDNYYFLKYFILFCDLCKSKARLSLSFWFYLASLILRFDVPPFLNYHHSNFVIGHLPKCLLTLCSMQIMLEEKSSTSTHRRKQMKIKILVCDDSQSFLDNFVDQLNTINVI